MATAGVQLLRSLAELDSLLSASPRERLVVIDFYADWMIAPFFAQLPARFPNAAFVKVNVDNSRDIMSRYGVRAMPTFVLLKGGLEVARIQGANQQALESAVASHHSQPRPEHAATDAERLFLQQFVAQSSRPVQYDDEVSQTLALSLCPIDKLREESKVENKTSSFLLAKNLLTWFKKEFFTWTNSPTCNKCNIQTKQGRGLSGSPTKEEIEDGADRVEVYECESCNIQVRFPRYNSPVKLLETRSGRCGEFANCFALFCVAAGFDTRFIYDVTDHVWVEVWISELDRWVHCDPCEDTIDVPLLYEEGWGKKLSYVIAFARDHVVDVSWRYSANFKATLSRRTLVRESVLRTFLQKLNVRVQNMAGISAERKKELERRRRGELIEMLSVQKRAASYDARTTGSDEWKAARGEDGVQTPKKKRTVLRPNDKELDAKLFKIEYSVTKDVYRRGDEEAKGWNALAFKSKDIQRKVENDWKMTYLCRREGKEEAELEWQVDLSGLKPKKVRVRFNDSAIFEGGVVRTNICHGDTCARIPPSGELVLDELGEGASLQVHAVLSGGNGANAFQHAQLFRSKNDSQDFQFLLEIEF